MRCNRAPRAPLETVRQRRGYGTSMSLRVTRTIVEKDDKGYLEFNVAEADIPSEADLSEDEVRPRDQSARIARHRLSATGAADD